MDCGRDRTSVKEKRGATSDYWVFKLDSALTPISHSREDFLWFRFDIFHNFCMWTSFFFFLIDWMRFAGYLDGCNMECMSLLLGLEMSATFSSSLIIGHGSDGIFIGFKSLLLRDRFGTLSYLVLLPPLARWPTIRTSIRNVYNLHSRQHQLGIVGCVYRPPIFISVAQRSLSAFEVYRYMCQIWRCGLITIAIMMAMAINAHSKLESYIREHSDLVLVSYIPFGNWGLCAS